jgi:hypothetical protein
MRLRESSVLLIVVGGTAIAVASCGREQDCLALPCPLPVAIVINVTGGTAGASVDGAVIQVSGAAVATISCGTICRVPGTAGAYTLTVTAPGFEPMRRTIVVQGTTPSCGCPTVVTEEVAVELVASSS